jgi:hypothetical protein
MVDINELYKRAHKTTGNGAASAFAPTAQPPKMTFARISAELGEQLGRPVDLGLLGNYQHKHHVRALKKGSMKKIATEQEALVVALSVDALKANVELIREEMRITWGHAYATLGERAAISEMTSTRKFEAVLGAGRELLYGDRGEALERLERNYESGLLTDADYEFELNHLFDRYRRLQEEFMQIVNERGMNVRTAFRTPKK